MGCYCCSDERQDALSLPACVEDEEEAAKETARSALKARMLKAMVSRDLAEMRQAADEGTTVKLESAEFDALKKALVEDEAKAQKAAQASIADALASGKLVVMRAALQTGIAANLDTSELDALKKSVAAEVLQSKWRKEHGKAQQALETASRERQEARGHAQRKNEEAQEKTANMGFVASYITGCDDHDAASKEAGEAEQLAKRASQKKKWVCAWEQGARQTLEDIHGESLSPENVTADN